MPNNVTQDELDLFNSYNISDNDGNFTYENYRKWFKDYVNNRVDKEAKLSNVTEVIEKANQISLTATDHKPTKDNVILTNGLFTKDELLTFIIDKVDVNELKNVTKEIIKDVLKEEPHPEEKVEEPTKDVKIERVKMVLAPLFKKCSIEDNFPKNIEEELTQLLQEEGISNEEVTDILENIDEVSSVDEKKEKPYNPYNDWKYIYYMWTLGHDYSRFLFTERKPLGLFKGLFVEEEKNKTHKFVFKKMNAKYAEEYHSINDTFGLRIDIDELIENIEDSKYFENLVKKSYQQVKSMVTDSVDFIQKINTLCINVATVEKKNFEPYGGMNNIQVKNLLKELREPDCNYTLKATNALKDKFGNLENSDPKKVGEFIERNFRVKYYEAELNPSKYKDLMSEAIAMYNIVDKLHRIRGLGTRLFGKSGYAFEENSLKNMKVLLDKELSPEKKEFINKCLDDEIVYKPGYMKELKNIDTFSLDLATNSYEIIENEKPVEKMAIDIQMDSEKEEIKENIATPLEEITKDNS